METETPAAPDQQPPVRISRRKLIGGAAATAALLTAGGATAAVVMHERGSGATPSPATGGSAKLDPGLVPASDALDNPDVRLRHLLRRTTFAATPADLARYDGASLDDVVDDLLASPSIDDSAADQAVWPRSATTSRSPARSSRRGSAACSTRSARSSNV